MLTIIGIDPGTRITGFAVINFGHSGHFNPKNIKIRDAGILKTDPKRPYMDRIGLLHRAIHALCKAHQPDLCSIEKAFTGINHQSALRLGEARGSMISAVARCGVDLYEVNPTKVKKSITGNGKATKEEVARAVEYLVNFKRGKLPFDVTDAMAIALSGALESNMQPSVISKSNTVGMATMKV